MMKKDSVLIARSLTTPRVAAIAGIIFAVLLMTSQLLIQRSISVTPLTSASTASEIVTHLKAISLALNLMPFAGIAFLWFIGVVRDRIGGLEDRFFATILLGSGLLYLAMFFASIALAGGLLRILSSGAEKLVQSDSYALSRAEIDQLMNVYGIKMAAAFMISVSTVGLRIRMIPRWISFLGYALAIFLLLSVGTTGSTPLVFPAWVFLISMWILIEQLAVNQRLRNLAHISAYFVRSRFGKCD